MTEPIVAEPKEQKKILIIEDEPDIVRGLRDALQFEGFEVDAKSTGAEGLVAAMDWGPDCVLLDLMLPDDNGYRICETARGRQRSTVSTKGSSTTTPVVRNGVPYTSSP